MFTLALFIGIYSYAIFTLGILEILSQTNIFVISFIWLILLLFFEKNTLYTSIKNLQIPRLFLKAIYKKPEIIFILLFVIQALINFIGVLGPELAFDALWYHLTLPKLYLMHHSIYHIPGNLLYYSDMPKLGEMLYVGALFLGGEVYAKIIHFIFGIVTAITVFKFSRKFFNLYVSVVIVSIFYANLVVDWESITAYIDLQRTFFEFLALVGLINWYQSQKYKWLVVSGVMMGLAITTKVLAIGSFFILLIVLLSIFIVKQKSIIESLQTSFIFSFFSFLIPLPWFIFSFIHTGNPVYPFFTKTYEISANSPDPLKIIPDLWNLFLHSADPISPLYLLFLPLLFVYYPKLNKEIKIIVWYSGLSLILWYFTPRTGGGRFILPYLPAFSITCGAIYSEILKKTEIEWRYVAILLLIITMFVSLISIGYRGLANKRYLPVILGKESKKAFLTHNLNFGFGDFYDTDSYFVKHIKSSDSVLLYGFHNLYYIDFSFIDSSWVKKGDRFDYIATQNTRLPVRFANWHLIYSNDKTMVKLYGPPGMICNKLCNY